MHIIISKNIAKTIIQKDIVKRQQRNSNGILSIWFIKKIGSKWRKEQRNTKLMGQIGNKYKNDRLKFNNINYYN